jgi:hypothetical protein
LDVSHCAESLCSLADDLVLRGYLLPLHQFVLDALFSFAAQDL